MFIRETVTINKKTKKKYITHKLVEGYRTNKGVRQRVVISLGTINLSKKYWKELAAILESRISGQLSFLEENKEISNIADDVLRHNTFVKRKNEENLNNNKSLDIESIDLSSVTTTSSRTLGPELVVNTFWNKLNFDDILEECGFDEKQIAVSKILILGRLIKPNSELATWRWFKSSTSLIEMTKVDISGIGKDAFYETGDLLLENKEKIEQTLFQTEENIFSLGKRVFLYDLTNTYFEGNAKNNTRAKRGHSKEKRADCPLVTLALVVDEFGFPVLSQIYNGNQSEPKTLSDILESLEKNTAQFINREKPILIMDRGIATKDNITLIKSKKYPYTVINRRESEKEFISEFTVIKKYLTLEEKEVPAEWECIDETKNIYVMKKIVNGVCYVLSVSVGRTAKEHAMDTLKEQRFNEDMNRLKKSFEKGNILIPVKVAERIGRIKGKYPSACKYYEIEIKISEDNKKVIEIKWEKKPERKERSTLTGCYVIETTQQDLSAKEIWKQYMQLTRVESSFQDLKSELGLRPVYHQNESRTDSHLFIGVLAYHLLNAIEFTLKNSGENREWKTIKDVLNTHQRNTIILKNKDDKIFHIKVSASPEACHNEIYKRLNIKSLLKRFKSCVIQRLL